MAQKTTPEKVCKVMTLWSVNQNLRETSRELGIPLSTVKDIVDRNKDTEKWKRIRTQKQDEFVEKATEIIDKGLILLRRRLNRAINEEESLDLLIEEIFSTDKEEISQDEKNRLVTKIKQMQMQNVKDITTAIGTLYDKRALSRGESTQNIDFATNFDLNKLMDIAGYTKKEDADD